MLNIWKIARRLSLTPLIGFVAGAMTMANHVYDVGPDSTPLQLEMAGWIIHGSFTLLALVLLELVRRVTLPATRTEN